MHAAAWWRELSFDWDVAPTPAGPARRATYGAINLLGIGRQTKEPDAAWAFAGVALSPEADLEIASGFGSVVLRQSGIPAWRERMKSQRPNNLDLIEETAKGLSLEPLSKPHPQIGQVEAILKREMDALLLDSKPPEEVTRTIASEGNALLGAK
jgi:ABC-type glycerol-3-phosphate transport system substrate-binding protein